MNPKVSFIIPALNEEKGIPVLINNIRRLDKNYNYEIIVADNNSTDKTREIAETIGAKVIRNSKDAPKTIANVRNTGASIASGEIFIFCDADTVIQDPNKFLPEVFLVLENPEIIGGAPSISIFPDEAIWKDKISHFFYNNIVHLSFMTKFTLCGGECQVVRKSSFREVNGYNVDIVHAEDCDFFRRLHKIGKLHFFSELVVYESPRRYRKYGYTVLFLQAVYSHVYQLIFKKNAFKEWKKIEY
jgi:glycosyltransferase involved in cell wall biosynthesis